MRFVSWNVNGIRAVYKKGLFAPFVESYKPDFLCLQETKAEQHQSEVDLPDYEEYWNSSSTRKGYSGTAIFVKTNINTNQITKHKPVAVHLDLPHDIAKKYKLEGDSYGNPNGEGRVVALEMPKFFVVTVYTPNAKDDLSRVALRHKHWDPAFLEYMKRLEETKPVIFCGDLNVAHQAIDLANPKANEGKKGFTKEEREGIDEYIKAGFVDIFRHLHPDEPNQYTWWSHFANSRARNVGWRIDYFFVSKKLVSKVTAASILPSVMGSDHCPVFIELDI